MDKRKIKQLLSPYYKIKYRIRANGWIYIGKQVKLVNRKRIEFNDGDQIAPYCLICPHGDAVIRLGKNVNIGMFSRAACINEIIIGDNTFTGPNVFISDYNHAYENVHIPISAQGNTSRINKVIIEEDCWIGTNVVICGNVHIGKHTVIGAGAFVNRDIPSYCVAVGNPARVIKTYNFSSEKWERISTGEQI